MATDRYQALRDALAAGPTPGAWRTSAGAIDNPRLIVEDDIGHPICALSLRGVQGDTRRMQGNAELIAAANPDTIRALLAERDAFVRAAIKLSAWDLLTGQNLDPPPGPDELAERDALYRSAISELRAAAGLPADATRAALAASPAGLAEEPKP